MARTLLHEAVRHAPRAEDIDEEAGIIRNVKALGRESQNDKRRYSDPAISDAVRLYEGAKVYLNHNKPNGSDRVPERLFEDWVGILRSTRRGSDGAYADLHVIKDDSANYKKLFAAARDFPEGFGLSHHAYGETIQANDGGKIVESVESVVSVDIVTEPATNAGLFESKEPDMPAAPPAEPKKITLRKLLDTVSSKTPGHKQLREMVEEGLAPPEMEVEAEPEKKPEDQIMEGLKAAIVAKLDSATPEQIQAVMEALEIDDTLSGQNSGGGEAEEATESLRRELNAEKAKNLLLEAGIEATAVRVEALAATSKKKELLESWTPTEAPANPNQPPKPSHSPPARTNGSGLPDVNANYQENYRERFLESHKRALQKLAERKERV